MASVVVRRIESGWRDRMRAYKVLIDDREAGRLKRGGSARFDLLPGQHSIQVAIDWKRSASFEVTGDGDGTLSFGCGARGAALSAPMDLFKRRDDTWLFVEPDGA